MIRTFDNEQMKLRYVTIKLKLIIESFQIKKRRVDTLVSLLFYY